MPLAVSFLRSLFSPLPFLVPPALLFLSRFLVSSASPCFRLFFPLPCVAVARAFSFCSCPLFSFCPRFAPSFSFAFPRRRSPARFGLLLRRVFCSFPPSSVLFLCRCLVSSFSRAFVPLPFASSSCSASLACAFRLFLRFCFLPLLPFAHLSSSPLALFFCPFPSLSLI